MRGGRTLGIRLALAGAAAVGFVLAVGALLRGAPEGAPTTATATNSAGEPVEVTLTRRTVSRDALPDRVLPAPAPARSADPARRESARTLTGLGIDAWRRGELREALDQLEASVAADPDDASARTAYGRLLLLMTDYGRARTQLERAASLRPDDAQVWLDLRTLYERSVLLERASYARERAEEIAARKPIVRNVQGFWVLEGTSIP